MTTYKAFFHRKKINLSGVETTLCCSDYTLLYCSCSEEDWKGDSDWRWSVRAGSSKTTAEFWDGCDCSGGKSKYTLLRYSITYTIQQVFFFFFQTLIVLDRIV